MAISMLILCRVSYRETRELLTSLKERAMQLSSGMGRQTSIVIHVTTVQEEEKTDQCDRY